MLENERSFLITVMPDVSGAPMKEIAQHYLSDTKEPLRLRAANGKFELTKKLTIDPTDRSRREEINVPLTEDEYRRLLPLAVRGLTKCRYHFPLPGGLTAELDVFLGALEGFTKVEVEFPDDATRAAFQPPNWFGRDITQEFWSGNSWLAGKTFADVQRYLTQKV